MKIVAGNIKRLLNALCTLLLIVTTMFAAGAILGGCDVHEFPVINEDPVPDPEPEPEPEPEPVIPTHRKMVLHLQFDTLMPLHKNVTVPQTKSSKGGAQLTGDGYDVRYIVNVYPNENGTVSRTLDTSFVITRDRVDSLDYTAQVELEGGDYTILVWSDYVNQGSLADNFYNTDDFTKLYIGGDEHIGGNDYRDAFRGSQQSIVQAPVSASDTLAQVVEISMGRPMAKYKFISTDYKQFITYATQLAKERALQKAWNMGRMGFDNVEMAGSKAPDISGYTIVFKYSGYMPHQFNMFTNKPSDSKTGVTYRCSIDALGEEEALLGFDYVFVNGSESSVQVALQVEDNEGNVIANIGTIDVPLVRSKVTEVRGAFLTSKAQGGIGIDPGFDNEYNIFIR